MQATAATTARGAPAPETAARIVGWLAIVATAVIVAWVHFTTDAPSATQIWPAIGSGLYAGLLAWLAWSLGRALAPDEPWAGVLAIVLGGAPVAMLSGVTSLQLALLLLVVQHLHQTHGLAISAWRLALIVVLTVIAIAVVAFFALAGAGALLFGLSGALAFILSSRRRTGPRTHWPHEAGDRRVNGWRVGAIVVLTMVTSAGISGWPIGLGVTLAFLLDARLSTGQRARTSLWIGLAALLFTAAVAAVGARDVLYFMDRTPAFSPEGAAPITAWLGVLAVVGAGAALVLRQGPVASLAIRRGAPEPIEQDRTRAALLVALVFVAGPLLGGWPTAIHALPVAGVLTAVAIGRALPFGRVRAVPA